MVDKEPLTKLDCSIDKDENAINDDACFSPEIPASIQCGKRNKDGISEKSLNVSWSNLRSRNELLVTRLPALMRPTSGSGRTCVLS